jgi:23S rRNA pseudouridine1911/1915/1917 synthase
MEIAASVGSAHAHNYKIGVIFKYHLIINWWFELISVFLNPGLQGKWWADSHIGLMLLFDALMGRRVPVALICIKIAGPPLAELKPRFYETPRTDNILKSQNKQKVINEKIRPELAGERMDQALAKLLPEMSRRAIRRLIDQGAVYKNKARVRVASRTVMLGDSLTIYLPDPGSASDPGRAPSPKEPYRLNPTSIIQSEQELFVVNKPAGIPSQATRDQAVSHMERAVALYFRQQKLEGKPILAHRLDKETSGILVFATSSPTAAHVFAQFKNKTVIKEYLAISFGLPRWQTHEVSNHLCTLSEGKGMVRAVHAGGRTAITHFRVLATRPDLGLSLIAARPLTGRSHQIRVHLSDLGLPIVGDKRYLQKQPSDGHEQALSAGLERHMLHAWRLSFPSLSGKFCHYFCCPPDGSFLELMKLFSHPKL